MMIRTRPGSFFYHLVLTGLFSIAGCVQQAKSGHEPPAHHVWDALLRKHVVNGKVDYRGFARDSAVLNVYLDSLSRHPPVRGAWTREDELAYWINAYNAFTVKLILDHYPLSSIRDIPFDPGLSSVWHVPFFSIGGERASLDQIEHEILRKQFDEPRIHFAIVCASNSCPSLRSEAYTGKKLDRQLYEQTRKFINDPDRNTISAGRAEVSQIFNWFREDFTRRGTLVDFLNRYSGVKIDAGATIVFKAYDWRLNEQTPERSNGD